MTNIQIKKFEFQDLSSTNKNHGKSIIGDITPEAEDTKLHEDIDTSYADHNILNEIGQNVPNDHNKVSKNTIKMTQEELDTFIAKAQKDAIDQYVASQPVVENNDQEATTLLFPILENIKNRFEAEVENLLEKILKLVYVVAAKVIDIELIKISQEDFIRLISQKMKAMQFYETVKIEVKDVALAEALANSGIEVSVNNDMLANDYKIIWCNGFLERNSSEIAAQIEETLIDQLRK